MRRMVTSAPYADSLGLSGSFGPGLPSSKEKSYNNDNNDDDDDNDERHNRPSLPEKFPCCHQD